MKRNFQRTAFHVNFDKSVGYFSMLVGLGTGTFTNELLFSVGPDRPGPKRTTSGGGPLFAEKISLERSVLTGISRKFGTMESTLSLIRTSKPET